MSFLTFSRFLVRGFRNTALISAPLILAASPFLKKQPELDPSLCKETATKSEWQLFQESLVSSSASGSRQGLVVTSETTLQESINNILKPSSHLNILFNAQDDQSSSSSSSPSASPSSYSFFPSEKISQKNNCISLNIAASFDFTWLTKMLLDLKADPNSRDSSGKTPLMISCRYNSSDTFHLLLDRGADPNLNDYDGNTPLSEALINGNFGLADELIKRGAKLSLLNRGGLSFLTNSIFDSQDTELIRYLLQKGWDVNHRDKNGTPLLVAVGTNKEKIGELLLSRGADPNVKDDNGDTPLHHAAHQDNIKMAFLLLNKNAQIDAENNEGITPLHLSILERNEKMAELLISRGADVSRSFRQSGFSPLLLASGLGLVPVARMLLEKGADIHAFDPNGLSPLNFAALEGHEEMVKFLLSKGAKVERLEGNRMSTLAAALKNEQYKVADILLQNGSDVNERTKEDQSLLHIFSFENIPGSVRYLLDHGAEIDAEDDLGHTPLAVACLAGNEKTAKLLLEKGADFTIKPLDDSAASPFEHVVGKGSLGLAKAFLERGLDVNEVNAHGFPPLYVALYEDQSEMVRLLVSFGADPNFIWNRSTPLSLALSRDNRRAAEILLEHGAEIDGKNHHGFTSLHFECAKGLLENVRFLVERGADLNVVDDEGDTPLLVAVSLGRVEFVQYLVEKGADTLIKNASGLDAFSIANHNKNRRINDILFSKNLNTFRSSTSPYQPSDQGGDHPKPF